MLKKILLVAIIVFLVSSRFFSPSSAQAYTNVAQADILKLECHVISFEDDPVDIRKATVVARPNKVKTIFCELNIEAENQLIEAVQFNFVFYDIFNEYLYTLGAISMGELSPGTRAWAQWETSFYQDWTSYTAIIYVNKVRLGTGEIWHQDKEKVAQEIVKIEKLSFEREQLEETEEK